MLMAKSCLETVDSIRAYFKNFPIEHKLIIPLIRTNIFNRDKPVIHYTEEKLSYSNAHKYTADALITIESPSKSDLEETKFFIIKNREPKRFREEWSVEELNPIYAWVSDGMYCKRCNIFNQYITVPN